MGDSASCDDLQPGPPPGEFDAWRAVLSKLHDPRDLRAASIVCRDLRVLCQEEPLWAAACRRWWGQRHDGEPQPRRWPEGLKAALNLSSLRSVYQALHLLGPLDLGLWLDTKGTLPRGGVVMLMLEGSKMVGRRIERKVPDHLATLDMPMLEVSFHERLSAVQDIMSSTVEVAVEFYPAPFSESIKATIDRWGSGWNVAHMKAISQGSGINGYEVHNARASILPRVTGLGHHSVTYLLGRHCRGGHDNNEASVASNQSEGIASLDVLYRRIRPMPGGPQLSSPEEVDRYRELKHLEGVWWAPYGGHGNEIIQLAFTNEQPEVDAGVESGGITGLRLVGRKITGDPNVPSGRVSFVVGVMEETPLEETLGDRRLVLGFPRGGQELVDLDHRQASQALPCQGQINRVPGLWEPEWVEADFLMYNSEGSPEREFSILWKDSGMPWRHIMDFQRLEAPPGWHHVLEDDTE